jgi:hypothetical protein
MAQVKLLIERPGECGCGYYHVKTRARTARGLLKKARELASEYSNYFLFDWHDATVYIYDPSRKKEYDDGTPVECLFWTPAELYNKGGYKKIVDIVKDAQGVELKI